MIEQPMQDDEMESATPGEQETFETMVAGLRDHIFGAAEEGIRAKFRQSQDIHEDIGAMALALIMEAGKQAETSGVEVDFEMLLSVGAEVIDDMLEIAEAMGVIDGIDDDDREKAMLSAVRAYLMSADVPPEEQEAAKAALQQMQLDGSVDEAASRIQRLGEQEGVDPFAEGEQVAPRPRMMEG